MEIWRRRLISAESGEKTMTMVSHPEMSSINDSYSLFEFKDMYESGTLSFVVLNPQTSHLFEGRRQANVSDLKRQIARPILYVTEGALAP